MYIGITTFDEIFILLYIPFLSKLQSKNFEFRWKWVLRIINEPENLYFWQSQPCPTKDYNCQKGSQTSLLTLADIRVKKGEHVWMKRKKILRIQLEFCIFYMSSLFHPGTHNSSRCQKIQATLCSNFGEVCEPFWWS